MLKSVLVVLRIKSLLVELIIQYAVHFQNNVVGFQMIVMMENLALEILQMQVVLLLVLLPVVAVDLLQVVQVVELTNV